jgi:hypothetical protein
MKKKQAVLDIKCNLRRRVLLCLLLPPCIAVVLVCKAVKEAYAIVTKDGKAVFMETWRGKG